ncbi:152_t:CDS:1 [Funneliformis mosseae]|uniref:152_t:CDS:1 n=1 Tax=Funneliformis mosseae TaxID=27381 RepID=A0A9N8V8J0_FUNMO|nr:152_t:CDS:1 [Funneliformis mosseae]
MDAEEREHLNQPDRLLPKESSTIFPYAKYLERYSVKELTAATNNFLIYETEGINHKQKYISQSQSGKIFLMNKEHRLRFQEALVHLFLRQSEKLVVLDVKSTFFRSDFMDLDFFGEILKKLVKIPSFQLAITNEIENFCTKKFFEFLEFMSNNCSRFNEFRINLNNPFKHINLSPLLFNIIQRQDDLNRIYLMTDMYSNVLSSLKSYNSLTCIGLSFTRINDKIIESLTKCVNLSKLTIDHCDGLTLDYCKRLSNESFQKLKELSLAVNKWNHHLTASFISSVGGPSIERLTITSMTNSIMEQVLNHCSNVKTIKLDLFEINLELLQKIERMKFEHLIINSLLLIDHSHNVVRILSELAGYLPSTTKHLTFNTYQTIFKHELNNILNKSNCSFVSLDFRFEINTDLLNIILNYATKKSCLKYLGLARYVDYAVYTNYFKPLNQNLLTQFKDSGVKVVNFNGDQYNC